MDKENTAIVPRTMWEIAIDHAEFEQLLESIDGDISQEDAARIQQYFEDIETEKDQKLEAYGRFITSLEARAHARKAEAERIAALGKADQAKADHLRKRLTLVFKFANWKIVQTPSFKFNLRGSGGVKPLFISDEYLDDPHKLPEKFRKSKEYPNNEEIRKVLEGTDKEAKKELLGIAYLGERSVKVQIS